MHYWRLNPECYCVTGSRNGAIYNVFTGQLMHLDEEESRIIANCEKNIPVNGQIGILEQLGKMHWGCYFDKPVYIDKTRIISKWQDWILYRPAPMIFNATLQITNQCNLDCSFCGKVWCPSCNRIPQEQELSLQEWIPVIDQLEYMSCQSLCLTGGEATLYPEINGLLNYVQDKFRFTMLITNGVSLTEVPDKIHTMVNIFPKSQYNPSTLETITKNLEKMKNFSLNIIGGEENDKKRYMKYSPKNIFLAPLQYEPITKKTIPMPSLFDFEIAQRYKQCRYGKITISHGGYIIPCLMMPDKKLANVRLRSVASIVGEELWNNWENPNQTLEKCSACEFRYACKTCDPAIIHSDICTYKPVEGRWIQS